MTKAQFLKLGLGAAGAVAGLGGAGLAVKAISGAVGAARGRAATAAPGRRRRSSPKIVISERTFNALRSIMRGSSPNFKRGRGRRRSNFR